MAVTREQVAGVRWQVQNIHAALADGTLREKTRKARRMGMLFSFAGIIWCKGIVVKKTTLLGGFEVDGLAPMIPFVLLGLLLFFGAQFWVYMKADRERAEYLGCELGRAADDLKKLKTYLSRTTPSSDSIIVGIDNTITDSEILMNSNRKLLWWDCVIFAVLLGGAVLMFFARYFLGWFVDPAPLVPHIPLDAVLWK